MLKIKRLGLIITEEEKRFVIQLARIEGGLSQSSLIRRLIHKAAEQNGLSNSTEDILELKLSADTESLKNLQVNHHENGGFTHD
jgi:hypothetical protein